MIDMFVKEEFQAANETDPTLASGGSHVPRPSKIAVISYVEIGQRVRELRQRGGFTQVKLAKALGTSQAALSQVEHGSRGLTVQQVVKLARTLGATPNEILGDGKRARAKTQPKNGRILRRLYRIEKLPHSQQQAVLKILDGIIEAHGKTA
jgi:transcriptional regulator with XRE-family HTH domain